MIHLDLIMLNLKPEKCQKFVLAERQNFTPKLNKPKVLKMLQ